MSTPSTKCERHLGDELELELEFEQAHFMGRTGLALQAADDCDDCRDVTALYDELRAELSTPTPATEIPSALDVALREAAARAGARIREQHDVPQPIARPSRARWIAVGAAVCAAAAIAIVVRLGGAPASRSETSEVAVQASSAVGDMNGDGRIDVVDALVLARALPATAGDSRPAGRTIREQKQWDTDGDGAVDQADVEWILRTAVTLEVGEE